MIVRLGARLASLDYAERDSAARVLADVLAGHGLTWDEILRDAPGPIPRRQVPPRARFWWELMPPRGVARHCLVWPALFGASETAILVDLVRTHGRLRTADRDFIFRMALRVPAVWPETW
ncbi:hypothetical protein HB662_26945 [Roseomonas frigidaquae]|uniref:Uncharacterized protein n=1 Tax=Falsiroseomonas frigidaquae TaxID=487318 RepID=A0ABX1F884_9PROT|nr:hypothetical protein [Falsiroseomonas frigidaquae]NKE48439.1 hypothetical protein [Falsiroseomonas frigidaquae]